MVSKKSVLNKIDETQVDDICADSAKVITNHKLGALKQLLAETIPLDLKMQSELPKEVALVCRKYKMHAGRTIANMLDSPDTSKYGLICLKEYVKKLAQCAISKEVRDAAIVIYYASIARALLNHGDSISRFSYKSQCKAYTILMKAVWLPDEFRSLFDRACNKCLNRAVLKKECGDM